MFENSVNSASLYLISTLFDLYISLLMIRLLLAVVYSNYFNPLTQFVVKLTNPIVKPIRKLIPNVRRLETATLLWIFALECIKFYILLMITYGSPNLMGILILALGDGLKLFFQILLYAIIFHILLNLLQPYSPINQPLQAMTRPILNPFQRLIPPISGIDLSPIPALILLQVLSMILASPLITLGMGIAVS